MRHFRGGKQIFVDVGISRRGFTLVELLVVIGIIATLVAMLLPSLRKARTAAVRVACASNLRQIHIASMQYRTTYRGFVPVFVGGGADPWHALLNIYLAHNPTVVTSPVFCCPGSRFVGAPNVVTYGPLFQGTYNFPTPKWHALPGPPVGWIIQNNWNDNYPGNMALPTTPNTAWRDPVNSIYIADAWLADGTGAYSYPSPETFSSNHLHKPPGAANPWTRRFGDFHGGTNCLFLDGRVELRRTYEMDFNQPENTPQCEWDVF